jgi:hypothetical protein
MSKYIIYTHRVYQPQAIKLGWTFWGFFFCAYWGLYHRLWIPAIIHFATFYFVFSVIEYEYYDTYMLVASSMVMVSAIIWGALGNSLRASKLSNNGYIAQTEVYANSPSEALGLFYNANAGK